MKKLNIDAECVQKCAELGLSNTDIATIFQCSEATIRQSFSNSLALGRAEMRKKLRMQLFAAADAGNPQVLIFLAKSVLGLSDKQAPEKPAAKDSELRIVVQNGPATVPISSATLSEKAV